MRQQPPIFSPNTIMQHAPNAPPPQHPTRRQALRKANQPHRRPPRHRRHRPTHLTPHPPHRIPTRSTLPPQDPSHRHHRQHHPRHHHRHKSLPQQRQPPPPQLPQSIPQPSKVPPHIPPRDTLAVTAFYVTHPSPFPLPLRILLLAAQPHRDPALLKSLIDAQTDWPEILDLARHHRLEPLIYLTLQTLAPPDIQHLLKLAATRNTFAALQAAAELRRLTTAIPNLLALKGLTLSQTLYGTPNARHVGDLDLLTPLPAPTALIESLGYTRLTPDAPLTPRRLAAYTRTWKDFTFESLNHHFELDLHWRLFNNPHHPANALLLSPPVTVTLFNIPLQTFPLLDQFLYTCVHALNESFTYLKTLADIAAFLNTLTQQQLNDALLRARTLHLLPQISAAIHLSNAWMLTTAASPHLLPPTHSLAVKIHRRTLKLLTENNFQPTREQTSPTSWTRLELLLTPTPRTFVEVARRFLVRPRLWRTVPLPDTLFFLYPLLAFLIPPRLHDGQSHAAPRTPLESPNAAGKIGVSKSPPNT